MSARAKTVRQSVSLPISVATKVRVLASARKLSATRMLTELVEQGLEADARKQQEFFELAEKFRSEKDPDAARSLGEQLGRLVFGG